MSDAEIEIYRSDGEPILEYQGGDIETKHGSKNTSIKNLFWDGVYFYTKEKSGKAEHICYFRATEKQNGRTEQFMAVYKGKLESTQKFANQIEEIVQESDQFHKLSRAKDKNMLAYLDQGLTGWPKKYSQRDIKMEIHKGERLVFKAGRMGEAAKFVNALFKMEAKIGDEFSAAVAANKSAVNDAEITIILDDSITGIKEYDENAQRNKQTPSYDGYKSDRPTGPGEWVKSKIPFL